MGTISDALRDWALAPQPEYKPFNLREWALSNPEATGNADERFRALQGRPPAALESNFTPPNMLPGQEPTVDEVPQSIAAPEPAPGTPPAAIAAAPAPKGAIGGIAQGPGRSGGVTPTVKAGLPSVDQLIAGLGGLPQQSQAPDAIKASLEQRGGKLGRERDDALAKALAEKDLSPSEKVAVALTALLPALLGTVGGAAAAGGLGATAGLAGGLNGGAAGVGLINDSKKERRGEALAAAEAAAQRLDKNDAQLIAHQDKLETQGFQAGEAEKGRKFEAGEHEKNRLFQGEQGALGRAAQRGNLLLEGKMAMDRLREELYGKLMAATDKGKPPTEAELAYNTNAALALRSADELTNTIKEHGTYEAPYIGDQKARALLSQRPQELGILFSKLVDPSTAAREGEVKNAIENIMNIGASTSVEQALQSLEYLKDFTQNHMRARELAKAGYSASEITKALGSAKYLPGPESFTSGGAAAGGGKDDIWSRGRVAGGS